MSNIFLNVALVALVALAFLVILVAALVRRPRSEWQAAVHAHTKDLGNTRDWADRGPKKASLDEMWNLYSEPGSAYIGAPTLPAKEQVRARFVPATDADYIEAESKWATGAPSVNGYTPTPAPLVPATFDSGPPPPRPEDTAKTAAEHVVEETDELTEKILAGTPGQITQDFGEGSEVVELDVDESDLVELDAGDGEPVALEAAVPLEETVAEAIGEDEYEAVETRFAPTSEDNFTQSEPEDSAADGVEEVTRVEEVTGVEEPVEIEDVEEAHDDHGLPSVPLLGGLADLDRDASGGSEGEEPSETEIVEVEASEALSSEALSSESDVFEVQDAELEVETSGASVPRVRLPEEALAADVDSEVLSEDETAEGTLAEEAPTEDAEEDAAEEEALVEVLAEEPLPEDGSTEESLTEEVATEEPIEDPVEETTEEVAAEDAEGTFDESLLEESEVLEEHDADEVTLEEVSVGAVDDEGEPPAPEAEDLAYWLEHVVNVDLPPEGKSWPSRLAMHASLGEQPDEDTATTEPALEGEGTAEAEVSLEYVDHPETREN